MARGGGTVSPRFLEADKVQVGSVPRVDEGKDTSSRAKTSNVVGQAVRRPKEAGVRERGRGANHTQVRGGGRDNKRGEGSGGEAKR